MSGAVSLLLKILEHASKYVQEDNMFLSACVCQIFGSKLDYGHWMSVPSLFCSKSWNISQGSQKRAHVSLCQHLPNHWIKFYWLLERCLAPSLFLLNILEYTSKGGSYFPCFSLPASANSSIKNCMPLCRVWCSLSPLEKCSKYCARTLCFVRRHVQNHKYHQHLPKYTFK